MSDFPRTARVVIIGGGVVGTSSLFHLARAGWSDCVLLEKNELTAGSTWHAAGNVPTFSTSWSLMNMQRYSTELYAGLAAAVDYSMNYHVTGSLRLGHSQERMQEFSRASGMGLHQGMELEILSPKETRAKYPFLETHDLKGALYDPADGDIDPAQLTQALAKGARDMGARILRFCPATGVSRAGGEWIIHTERGDIRCEYVVNAAGYYAQRVGEWFRPFGGRRVPMMVMSHQYMLTEEIPEIMEYSRETGEKLPLLRDVDTSYYLRQEKNGLNLGPYEKNCCAHWASPEDPMPEDFSFQLYPDDLERLEWYIEDAMARVPLLGKTGISKVINGPIPYTPDGNPLIGPMPGVPNAFEACVFTFGIAQGGGAGKVLAEWITEGQPDWDMWSCDPRRFTDYTDSDYCLVNGRQIYANEYAMHFPHHRWPAGKDKKLSPIDADIRALGGQMGAYNGWERANWFAREGDDISESATQTWGRAGPWQARIREECEAVRDGVGVLDLPGFARYHIKGRGADEWLRGFGVGGIPKIGRIGLIYVADSRGRILTEMSAMRVTQDEFYLITAGAAEWHDLAVIKSRIPDGSPIQVVNETADYMTQILAGPKSRDVLSKVCDGDLSQPWLSHQLVEIMGHFVRLARVCYAGELGWELHSSKADTAEIFSAIMAEGKRFNIKPFGMFALESLRLEKGYRTWKGDLSTDYSILEAGLDRFVKLDKPQDFVGKAAISAERERGVKRRFVTLIVDAGEADSPYMSTIWHDDSVVGETTSGGWGYRVGASISLAMVRADLAQSGTELEVEIYGKRCRAIVQPDQPLWDPENSRIKA